MTYESGGEWMDEWTRGGQVEECRLVEDRHRLDG